MTSERTHLDAAWDPWDPWPTTAQQVAMTLAVPPGMATVCDCNADQPDREATNPDDRSQQLPHHFDCAAVTAWAVATHVFLVAADELRAALATTTTTESS